jgi:hypothetical protein
MKAMAIVGLSDDPNKVLWLREKGINFIRGAQFVMRPNDMFPGNLATYDQEIMAFLEKTPDLERISVMIQCWPHQKRKDDKNNVIDVAMVSTVDADHFSYVVAVCQALQQVHNRTGIAVDISYHPLMAWPRVFTEKYTQSQCRGIQEILWNHELGLRKRLMQFLRLFDISDVSISIENEPPMSDENGNLVQMGNRLFSEQTYDLPLDWCIVADIQHCNMFLDILNSPSEYASYSKAFPPIDEESRNPDVWNWKAQFEFLRELHGDVTLHLSQMDDPLRHTGSAIRFNDPIMDWPLILDQIKRLVKYRKGDVWWAIEAGAFPNYDSDLAAFNHVQTVLES